MVRTDDGQADRARLFDCREMIDGINLVAARARSKVARANRPLHSVRCTDQQATAFVGHLDRRVRDDLLEHRLTNLNVPHGFES